MHFVIYRFTLPEFQAFAGVDHVDALRLLENFIWQEHFERGVWVRSWSVSVWYLD